MASAPPMTEPKPAPDVPRGTVERIAELHLGIRGGLDTRWDASDHQEVPRWDVRAALEAAYRAGRDSAAATAPQPKKGR